EVRDDGEGVPPDMSEQIFDPYTTAHERVSGSVGLGLSVSRQLASMMGGSLTYTREGEETVFRLELPPVTREAQTGLVSSLGAH
ncbi:MAG: hybrid sensor histidine kinase/response regulator, partial [Anaerolineae bacterium]|nr:hybrid sensor histidine kinase/response regulator [Anaerolineae bacterium]